MRTKHGANKLCKKLETAQISAMAIHGNKSQGARTRALAGFKNRDNKFVVGQTKEEWEELDEVVNLFRDAGVKYPVWIMPVGARSEEQEATAGDVAKMAFERGYNVSGRMHVYLFGNAIGT